MNDNVNTIMLRRWHLWMAKWPRSGVAAWALAMGFVTYFCMYAFRKPFLAATFENVQDWPLAIDFKSVLIISQVLGYTISKVIGIKIASESRDKHRGWLIFGLILFSECSLWLFAVVPPVLKPLAMFFNGLPLGMIWGLVLRYLEGRKTSEIITAGLCTSFILGSGVVKSAGRILIENFGVSDFWMPVLTGLVFLPITGLAIALLAITPPPDKADCAERLVRSSMSRADRQAFFDRFKPGLFLLGAAFVALGALRDFRDNFAAEIWKALGFGDVPAIFTLSEVPAALLVLAAMSLVTLERRNRSAVRKIHGLMLFGVVMALVATLLFQIGLLQPAAWMVMLGAGIYLGFVPCTSILADRLIASLRSGGNAGYLVNLFDAWAYFGSLGILIYFALRPEGVFSLNFFLGLTYLCLAIGIVGILASMSYFASQGGPQEDPPLAE